MVAVHELPQSLHLRREGFGTSRLAGLLDEAVSAGGVALKRCSLSNWAHWVSTAAQSDAFGELVSRWPVHGSSRAACPPASQRP